MAELPRLITLMTLQNFFEYDTKEGELHATLRYTSNKIISEDNFTLFEVEKSSSVGGMVHIKSAYNNRYLRLNPTGVLITATADELEEDTAKRSCTLFRFFISGDLVRFVLQADNLQWGVMPNHNQGRVLAVQGNACSFTFIFYFIIQSLCSHFYFINLREKLIRSSI